MRVARLLVSPSAVAGTVILFATPALAHVEVEATPAQALATNAAISVNAESESTSAGIVGSRIQLPSGLLASDVRLAAAPKGWRLTGSGQVVDVTGPRLPVGEDLKFTLRVRQLPQAPQLVLKMIQSYSDGRKDSWIELQEVGQQEPDFPAPVVKLRPAAAGATAIPRATPTTAAPSSAAATPTPSAAATTSAPATATAPASDDSSRPVVAWIGGAVALGLITGGVMAWRRRRASAG